MEEMDIKQIISLLIKHIWMIIIATIACGILGYVVSEYVLTEKYESSSLMYISSNKNTTGGEDLTYNEYNLNIKLVNSYSELCKTDRILNKVLSETNMTMTLDSLSKMISVNSVNNTEIIRIVVKNENPEVASLIANAVALVFIKDIPSIIKMDNVQIIDYATVPILPVEPNVLMNAIIAMIAGLFISVLVIFLIEFLDVTIKERSQLEEIIEAPVFGVIPRTNFSGNYNGKSSKGTPSKSIVKEAFVRLASNVSFLNIDNPKSVSIIITSSIMGEGKSTIVSNLGISLSQSNKRVLLIDADMRRPMIHKLFQLSNRHGLSTALTSKDHWKSFVLTTRINNLDVIVAGVQPPNPTMLLSTKTMHQLIDEAKDLYDYILIDTPPILVVSDILGICGDVDHILLVARCNQASIPDIKRVKNDLEQIKAPLSGAILNHYNAKSGKDSYYNYGYYQYHTGDTNNESKAVRKKAIKPFRNNSTNNKKKRGS